MYKLLSSEAYLTVNLYEKPRLIRFHFSFFLGMNEKQHMVLKAIIIISRKG